MFKTLRTKLLVGVVPLLLILVALGFWAVSMFHSLGGRIDVILKENYRSVLAAEEMKEAMERIDSALLFMLVGEEARGVEQYRKHHPAFEESLRVELGNITLPREQELVDRLVRSKTEYFDEATRFLAIEPSRTNDRRRLYFDVLLPKSLAILNAANGVLDLNQRNMEEQNHKAREAAARSTRLMMMGIFGASSAAAMIALLMGRSVLEPIRAVTRAAQSMAKGKLDQVVPVVTRDELGELALAFNSMARTIREFQDAGTARLLRARKTAQATIDSFPDPVIMLDLNGAVERANPAAKRILGVVAVESDGALFPWSPPLAIRDAIAGVLQGAPDALPNSLEQALCLRDGGQEKFFLPRVVAIRSDDGPLGAAVVLSDVTKFRLVDQLKSDMVSTVSHELKTPLTGLQMSIHLLLEEIVGTLNAKQVDLLLGARQDSDRLLTMINDLLDLARIEQGGVRFKLEPVSPKLLVQGSMERLDAKAVEHGITWFVDVPDDLPEVAVDLERINHVFDNLIGNAIDHNQMSGTLTISAERVDEANAVRFSVIDTGTGIAPEHLGSIFEKFYRVPKDGGTSPKGAGLGLAITKEIVKGHGGTIDVSSVIQKGTCFRFTLPIMSI